MVDILYTFSHTRFEADVFDYYLSRIPGPMQNSVLKYRRWQDAQASLLGKILLMKGLKKYGARQNILYDTRYTEYNRPYFNNGIHFNISHSGHCVICAFSRDTELGIDVEEIRPIEFRDFSSQFSEDEMNTIYKAEDRLFAFYELWTKKEAIIKADGRGMSAPLRSIDFKNSREAVLDKRKWYVEKVDVHDLYAVHLAASVFPGNSIQTEKIYF